MNLRLKKYINLKEVVLFFSALILLCLFSQTILSGMFSVPLQKSEIVITATSDKNKKSGGSDIRIVRILLDGEELSFDSIQRMETGYMRMEYGWW